MDGSRLGRVLRRALGGLLVAVLLVTALAFFIYSPYLTLTSATGPATPAARPAGVPLRTTSTRVASPTPVPLPSAQAPKADHPADPGGRQPGIRLVATVFGDGVFEITETVHLPAPVTHLTLAPIDLRSASSRLRSAHPIAVGVVVRAGDRAVELPRRTVQQASTVALVRPADRFEVRYRLYGTVKLNTPSSALRALGGVGPLVSRIPGDLPVAMSFLGKPVRNLSCTGLPVDQQACFAGRRYANVRANQDLPYRGSLVEVQLDLTSPPQAGPR